jgi:hypothetical protein
LAIFLLFSAKASDGKEWLITYQDESITMFSGERNKYGMTQYKIKLIIDTTLNDFLSFFVDVEHAVNWVYDTESVRLLKQVSQNQYIIQTIFNTPWPLNNRVLTTTSTIFSGSDGLSASIEISDTQDPQYLAQSDLIAIEHFQARYDLLQKGNKLIIQYQMDASSSGNIPNWLANEILPTNLLHTFINMREELSK